MGRAIRLFCIWICIVLLFPVLPVQGAEADPVLMAENISGRKLITGHSDIVNMERLFDGYKTDYALLRDGAQLTLSHEKGIASLFIRFGWEYSAYTVTDVATGESHTWGGQGILHEFLDLEAAFGKAPETVTLSFENGDAYIFEIYAFTSGQTPDFVQKWDSPAEGGADLVLFSTHGDDEQLFFAGLIPYYAREMDYQVQVVYMTDHRNLTLRRVGEMLDGLWAVGLETYPVFGSFGDFMVHSRDEAWLIYHYNGHTKEELLSFVVENIRRFRPKVAVGHDLNGEYGHGMHMIYADALCEALEISDDPTQFADSAQRYGLWDVPKTYLHLYEEKPIIMDWDQPLESFDGKTAYEVTRDLGFPCHVSQQTYYSWYFKGKSSAEDIKEYSPREFGLFRSTVGEDVQKNDFFENVTTHAEDEILALESQMVQTEPTVVTETQPEITEPTAASIPPVVEKLEAEQENEYGVYFVAVAVSAALLGIAAWITKRTQKNK